MSATSGQRKQILGIGNHVLEGRWGNHRLRWDDQKARLRRPGLRARTRELEPWLQRAWTRYGQRLVISWKEGKVRADRTERELRIIGQHATGSRAFAKILFDRAGGV